MKKKMSKCFNMGFIKPVWLKLVKNAAATTWEKLPMFNQNAGAFCWIFYFSNDYDL